MNRFLTDHKNSFNLEKYIQKSVTLVQFIHAKKSHDQINK